MLVLAVMIALASPFGTYVSDAVASTTNGLFETEKNALAVVGIDVDNGTLNGDGTITPPPYELKAGAEIPEGCTYTPKGGTELTSGTMPTLQNGDIFTDTDYKYTYSTSGWGVAVLDTTKTEYGAILESINGQPITSLQGTFFNCTSLETAPAIPSSVTMMQYTFLNCNSLETAPAIPSSVTNMIGTFEYCQSLTGDIEINANPTSYTVCFAGTSKEITLFGTSTKLAALAATSSNGNISY